MTNETTASQPKSIGDDAQFQARLADLYSARDESIELGISSPDDRAIAKLIDCIDNFRDPAAQASATIQAAPDKDAIRKVFMDYGFTVKAGETDLKQYVFDAANALLALAATVQKPVMVAEPVGGLTADDLKLLHNIDTQPYGEDGFGRGRKMAIMAADVIRRLAAPMVADPAGVALLDSRFLHSKEIASDEPQVDSTRLYFWRCGWNAYRDALAATVKAVPSEALDWRAMCESLLDIWDDAQSNPPESRCYLEGAWPAIIAEIREALAAPLADKTGGGE